jgi:hypothetical protein
MSGAQQLMARIKRSSKYYGQTPAGQWFEARVVRDSYAINGNDNHYRLEDVALGVRIEDGSVIDLSKGPAK